MKECITHKFLLNVAALMEEIITFATKLPVSFYTKNYVRYVIKT